MKCGQVPGCLFHENRADHDLKFLGVRRNFARILSNLTEKYVIKSDLKKKLLSIRALLFSNQSMLGAIFAQIFRKFYKVLRDFAWIKGRIKGGIFPGPPTARSPRWWNLIVSNKILVWKIVVVQKRYNSAIIFLCCVKYQGPPTATGLSTSLTVCQF